MSKHNKHRKRNTAGIRRGAGHKKQRDLSTFIAAGEAHRFPKGISGNPSGRAKDDAVKLEARRLLACRIPNDKEGRCFARGIVDQLGWMALAGDHEAAQLLFDRAFGRPRQAVDLGSGDVDPLTLLCQEMQAMSERLGPPEGQTRDTEISKTEVVQ